MMYDTLKYREKKQLQGKQALKYYDKNNYLDTLTMRYDSRNIKS